MVITFFFTIALKINKRMKINRKGFDCILCSKEKEEEEDDEEGFSCDS